MSQIGYYRYKRDDLPVGENQISFYKNGNLSVTHTVIIKEWCEGEKILKYLDKNGQYRFYPFNSFWEAKDKPKQLGKTNKLITSILTGQSTESNIGYKNDRTLNLVADDVTDSELEFLNDIWTSPRVYLFNGVINNDEQKDWIEVTITGDGTARRRKANVGKVSIDVILPEWFSVTML